MSKKKENKSGIPALEMDALARMFLPIVREFYESEEGRAEYERWKAEKKAEQSRRNNKKA